MSPKHVERHNKDICFKNRSVKAVILSNSRSLNHEYIFCKDMPTRDELLTNAIRRYVAAAASKSYIILARVHFAIYPAKRDYNCSDKNSSQHFYCVDRTRSDKSQILSLIMTNWRIIMLNEKIIRERAD